MRLPWVSRKHLEWVITRAASRNATLRQELEIAEDALEAERQWRLTSLPPLLAAEERAVKAEARLAQLERFESPHNPRQFPELRAVTRTSHLPGIAAAYHQSTNEERP